MKAMIHSNVKRSAVFGISIFAIAYLSWCNLSLNTTIYNKAQAHESNDSPVVQDRSYLERFKYYKSRYNYKPPESYTQHGQRDNICGKHPTYESYFNLPSIEQRSANNEDLTLFKTIFNETDEDGGISPVMKGGMLEIGAFDGIRESNSRFFDLCLGWNTLLIEANPRVFGKLVVNRPQAHRIHFAPTCTIEEEAMNKTIQFDNARYTNAGLADGSVETAYTKHREKEQVYVPCGHLTNVLLDIFPQGHVTLFSLDVEGSEPLVLNQIDLEKVFIEIFMIESKNSFCKENEECKSRNEFRKIMEDAGYERFSGIIIKSDLFIHPESRYLQKIKEL